MKLLAAITPITLDAPKTAAFSLGFIFDFNASCWIPIEAPQEKAMHPLKAAKLKYATYHLICFKLIRSISISIIEAKIIELITRLT